MAYTSPYQKTVTIHRAPLENNFLGINNDNWKAAARILNPPTFLLYIYFASNKDNFSLALSPKAIQQEIGMARSTFYDQILILESLGYLVKDESKKNGWHFYERPYGLPTGFVTPPTNGNDLNNHTAHGNNLSACGVDIPLENKEIYNKSSPKEDYKYILPIEEELESHKVKPPKTINGFVF